MSAFVSCELFWDYFNILQYANVITWVARIDSSQGNILVIETKWNLLRSRSWNEKINSADAAGAGFPSGFSPTPECAPKCVEGPSIWISKALRLFIALFLSVFTMEKIFPLWNSSSTWGDVYKKFHTLSSCKELSFEEDICPLCWRKKNAQIKACVCACFFDVFMKITFPVLWYGVISITESVFQMVRDVFLRKWI